MHFHYSPSDIARFWAKVNKTETCWLWIASTRRGYGRLQMGKSDTVAAHVMSYEIHVGEIPDDLWVLHHCDTPACVRPDHLFVGTPAENSADRNSKGRQVQGARVNTAKLTPEQVAEIRLAYSAGGVTQRGLARQYGVCKSMIGYIVRGEHWASVA